LTCRFESIGETAAGSANNSEAIDKVTTQRRRSRMSPTLAPS